MDRWGIVQGSLALELLRSILGLLGGLSDFACLAGSTIRRDFGITAILDGEMSYRIISLKCPGSDKTVRGTRLEVADRLVRGYRPLSRSRLGEQSERR